MVLPKLMKSLSPLQQDILIQQIYIRKAKLSNASELSAMFALFSLIGAVDLKINEGDASGDLIIVYVINTSLLVTNTVLVKIAMIWMSPRLDTAVKMSIYDVSEFDRIPHESLVRLWDIVYVLASTVGFLLFGIEFILITWIKYRHYSIKTAIAATAIISPVLMAVVFTAFFTYFETKHRRRREALVRDRQDEFNYWGEEII